MELAAVQLDIKQVFNLVREKSKGWNSKERGLHATLLQRATWRSVRDAYFAPPKPVQVAPSTQTLTFPPEKRRMQFIDVSFSTGQMRVL